MRKHWIAAAVLVALAAPAAAQEGKVTTEVRRVSPTETTITIHDTRPRPARAKRPSTPDFKEYDLAPAARPAPAPAPPAYAPPPASYAWPSETYSQTWAPGPNSQMARGGGGTYGTTLALGPAFYGYGGYGYGGGYWGPGVYAGGIVGPGPVVYNSYHFPYNNYNPFLTVPYVNPFPTPARPYPGGIPGQITVYPPPILIRP